MANSTSTMITSLTFIMLFTIAILGFAIGFANDNDADVRIDSNENISSMNVFVKSGLQTFDTETEEAYSSIVNSTIEVGSDVIKSPTPFVLTWGNLFSTFKNTIGVGYGIIFGSGGVFGIFLTAFISIIGILFTLYLIKAWRGNP